MTRINPLMLLLLVAVSASAQDKTADAMAKLNVALPPGAEERLALSAAPAHLRAGATVYVYGRNGYERIRTGDNGFVCLLNRDGFFYGSTQFKPTCWDAQGATTYVPVMLKVGEMLAKKQSADAIRKAISAGFADNSFHAPTTGGVAYMLEGDIDIDSLTGAITRQAYPGHYMFYANGVTSAQLGFTREAGQQDPTLPFVFSAGAGGDHGLAYIIVMPGSAHVHSHDGTQ